MSDQTTSEQAVSEQAVSGQATSGGTTVKIPPYDAAEIAQRLQAGFRVSMPQVTVILWEGPWCTQDSRAVVADTPRLGGGWNDEARSLTFYGPAGSIVTVFDSDNYRTDDDFAIIIKTNDSPVCVGSFELAPGQWGRSGAYDFYYSGGNGLNGKVTSVRFGQWW